QTTDASPFAGWSRGIGRSGPAGGGWGPVACSRLSGICGRERTVCEPEFGRSDGYGEERVFPRYRHEWTAVRDVSSSERRLDGYATAHSSAVRSDEWKRSELSNECRVWMLDD